MYIQIRNRNAPLKKGGKNAGLMFVVSERQSSMYGAIGICEAFGASHPPTLEVGNPFISRSYIQAGITLSSMYIQIRNPNAPFKKGGKISRT
jgi:hypothetical protein